MTVIDKPMKTRVFRTGNSQAIRIPKALELPKGHVLLEPRDGGLYISTLRGRCNLFFPSPASSYPSPPRSCGITGWSGDVDLKGLHDTVLMLDCELNLKSSVTDKARMISG